MLKECHQNWSRSLSKHHIRTLRSERAALSAMMPRLASCILCRPNNGSSAIIKGNEGKRNIQRVALSLINSTYLVYRVHRRLRPLINAKSIGSQIHCVHEPFSPSWFPPTSEWRACPLPSLSLLLSLRLCPSLLFTASSIAGYFNLLSTIQYGTYTPVTWQ